MLFRKQPLIVMGRQRRGLALNLKDYARQVIDSSSRPVPRRASITELMHSSVNVQIP
jgi:hypothetical protein